MVRYFIICLICALTACVSTYGKPITDDQISALEEGVSQREQVLADFGKPVTRSRLSDGSEVMAWAYARVSVLTGIHENRSISITFDQNGVLKSYVISEHNM